MGAQEVGPIVNDPGDERFHDTEFAVDPEYLLQRKHNSRFIVKIMHMERFVACGIREERIDGRRQGLKLKLPHEQHHEEDDGPHGGARKLEDHLRISEKHESWTAFNHFGHFGSLFQRDVAQDGESDATGQ